MKEVKAGCGIPMDSAEVKEEPKINDEQQKIILKEEQRMIMVGKPAPNFNAQAFYKGKFVNVSLEEFKGKWVYLCFYPGDFTFV
jgi:peroxiredoxin (alkyl hydroperoxide reductase subunit C)